MSRAIHELFGSHRLRSSERPSASRSRSQAISPEIAAPTSSLAATTPGGLGGASSSLAVKRRISGGREPHFQPGTRPACSIHLCISGPCASSRVVSLT